MENGGVENVCFQRKTGYITETVRVTAIATNEKWHTPCRIK